jgi:hypothetical protein
MVPGTDQAEEVTAQAEVMIPVLSSFRKASQFALGNNHQQIFREEDLTSFIFEIDRF